MSEKNFYYVNAVGEKVGPVTLTALKSLAKANILAPSTAIIPEGSQKMYEADKIPGIFDNVTGSHTASVITSSHSLTPLPNSLTQPFSPPKPAVHSIPPAPMMPLAPSPLESAVPMPLSLRSDGKKIIKPAYHSNDNWFAWCVIGVCFLFLFSSILVYTTWHFAAKQFAETEGQPAKEDEEQSEVKSRLEKRYKAEIKTASKESAESGKESSPEKIVAQTEKSIVLINSPVSCGTGFVVAPGVIATNSHVIASERIESLEITFPSAEKKNRGPFKPQLLYEDTVRDIALLKINSVTAPVLSAAKNYQFSRAQKIFTIGNPGRGDGVILENAVSAGILSTQTEIDGLPFYQLSIAVNPGNSGGPVLDDEGKVIGIITLKAVKTPSMAYGIPVDDMLHAIELSKTLTAKEQTEMNEKHLAVVSFRQGLERVTSEHMFGESSDSMFGDSVEALEHPNRSETFLQSNSQNRVVDKTRRDTSQSNSEPSWSQLSDAERESLMDSQREKRYKDILAKEVWTFNGMPIRGKIVGFQNGIVQIQPEGAANTEPPLERYARRFSPTDISDILFYARYNGLPTGTLGKR